MYTKKILAISCVIIMLCTTIIVGASYALFNETISVGNHLQAGNLDADLTRTNLKYAVLDTDGVLRTYEDGEDADFTGTTTKNIFGLNGDSKIVPGSYFEAEMNLANNGSVAFDYDVEIKLLGQSNELANQLQVTITTADGTKTLKLAEIDGKLVISEGRLAMGNSLDFTVKVEFIDGANNNDAQDQTCAFDLVVTAVQATE
jgi:hypothetical protein